MISYLGEQWSYGLLHRQFEKVRALLYISLTATSITGLFSIVLFSSLASTLFFSFFFPHMSISFTHSVQLNSS